MAFSVETARQALSVVEGIHDLPPAAREAWAVRFKDSVDVTVSRGASEGEAVARVLVELAEEARTIPTGGRVGFPSGLTLLWATCVVIVLYLCVFVPPFIHFYAGLPYAMPSVSLALFQCSKAARVLWPLAALVLCAGAVLIVLQWIGRWPRSPKLERCARILGSILFITWIASWIALFLPLIVGIRIPR